MNWGYKYCQKYTNPEFVEKFNKNGKKFLKFTNKCLPNSLAKLYKTSSKEVSCPKLSKIAFMAQSKCYQDPDSGFCPAFSENGKLFVQVLDPKDLFNMDSISVIQNSAEKCNPKLSMMSILLG